MVKQLLVAVVKVVILKPVFNDVVKKVGVVVKFWEICFSMIAVLVEVNGTSLHCFKDLE